MEYSWSLVRGWAGVTIMLLVGCASTPALAPPMAMRHPTTVTLGGVVVQDDYWWLRNKRDPKVIEYLNAENAYTDAILKPTQPLQDKLYDEALDRLPEVNESVPYRNGDWWYSSRYDHANDYPVFLRRKGSPTTEPVVISDENEMAKGHAYFDFSSYEISPDGNLMAFSTDTTGNRQYLLQIKDLRTGVVLADQLPMVDSFAWMQNNHTLYYVKQNDAKRSYRLYRHVLGSAVEKDELVYEEKDELFAINVDFTRDRKWIMCESTSKTQSEVRVFPSDKNADPILVEPRRDSLEYYLDHRNGRFFIRTNDTNRNFRIVTTPDNAPGSSNWTELVAADPRVTISDFDVFAHHIALTERSNGLPQVAIARLPDGSDDPAKAGEIKPTALEFKEPDFNVGLSNNVEFDPPAIRIDYASLTTPASTFDVSLTDGSRTLLKQEYVGPDFNKADYREERLFASASDGTKIPISLVYRKPKSPSTQPGATLPGPLLLMGYGAYGDTNDVYFSREQLSLLNRGVICAVAHVRGGGEFGRAWYDAGRMMNKTNTFDDFIAVAKYLESNGWTTPNKLAIEGASAGGLLIGASINRAPQLFHAAVAQVPWVDVLADMSDPSVPLTTLEYIEWGNPNIPDQRAYIAAYDPYTNVKPQAYPDLLVLESLNDSQVQYWDAVRWVAKLRAAKQQAGPAGQSQLLLKMDMDAGHDGPSGQESGIREESLINAWLLQRLGVEK